MSVPVLLIVPDTNIQTSGTSGTTMLFTVYTGGAFVGADLNGWVVPSGQTLRLLQAQINPINNTLAGSPNVNRFCVLATTGAGSITVTSDVGIVAVLQVLPGDTDIPRDYIMSLRGLVAPGTTVGMGMASATGRAHPRGIIIAGELF